MRTPALRHRVVLETVVDRNEETAATFNESCGVSNRPPNVTGVVEDVPRVDNVGRLEALPQRGVKNRALEDLPVG